TRLYYLIVPEMPFFIRPTFLHGPRILVLIPFCNHHEVKFGPNQVVGEEFPEVINFEWKIVCELLWRQKFQNRLTKKCFSPLWSFLTSAGLRLLQTKRPFTLTPARFFVGPTQLKFR